MIRRRFKYFMPERSEFSITGEETLLSVSEYYGVKPRADAFDAEAAESRAESLEGYRKVYAGDFVMNYMLAWKGAYGISEHDGIVSPAYAVYRINPRYANQRFIHHRLRSEHMRSAFKARSKGIIESRLRLYPDAFLSMTIELPDLETQRTIADFLDREIGRIDQLIEKKQRLVEHLAAKQNTVRDTAVCKGLNLQSNFKDSRVDWFGDVPAHWTVCRLNRLISSKVDYRGRTPEKVDDGIFLVTARNVRFGKIDYERSQEYTTKDDWEKLSARGKPEIGDIIFTTEAPLGQIAQVDRTDVAFAQRIMKLRANKRLVSNDFLAEFMMSASFQRSLQLFASGSTASGIKSERMAHLFGLAPPAEEQEAIVHYIRNAVSRLDAVVIPVEKSMDRLREFRAALITAAVTGRINVATWGKEGQTGRRLDKIEKAMRA